MTTRHNLVEDLQGVESILMLSRVIYHILEFLIRRTTW